MAVAMMVRSSRSGCVARLVLRSAAGFALLANACARRASLMAGGTIAQAASPFAVRLVITFNVSGTSRQEECSGTVIAPNAVLTAAHCVIDAATGWYAANVTAIKPVGTGPLPLACVHFIGGSTPPWAWSPSAMAAACAGASWEDAVDWVAANRTQASLTRTAPTTLQNDLLDLAIVRFRTLGLAAAPLAAGDVAAAFGQRRQLMTGGYGAYAHVVNASLVSLGAQAQQWGQATTLSDSDCAGACVDSDCTASCNGTACTLATGSMAYICTLSDRSHTCAGDSGGGTFVAAGPAWPQGAAAASPFAKQRGAGLLALVAVVSQSQQGFTLPVPSQVCLLANTVLHTKVAPYLGWINATLAALSLPPPRTVSLSPPAPRARTTCTLPTPSSQPVAKQPWVLAQNASGAAYWCSAAVIAPSVALVSAMCLGPATMAVAINVDPQSGAPFFPSSGGSFAAVLQSLNASQVRGSSAWFERHHCLQRALTATAAGPLPQPQRATCPNLKGRFPPTTSKGENSPNL